LPGRPTIRDARLRNGRWSPSALLAALSPADQRRLAGVLRELVLAIEPA
jgi:hypothetical protein